MSRSNEFYLKNCLIGAFALGVASLASSPVMSQSSPQSWAGFYVGGNVGGTEHNAFSGGGQMGYNYHTGRILYGIEGDIQSANIRGHTRADEAFPTSVAGAPLFCQLNQPFLPGGPPARSFDLTDPNNAFRNLLQATTGAPSVSTSAQCAALTGNATVRAALTGAFGALAPALRYINSPTAVSYDLSGRMGWFGTARGRLGVEAADGLLLYLTGGLAYGEAQLALATTTATTETTIGGNVTATTLSTFMTTRDKMLLGYAVGLGVEYAFNRRWSMKGEFLHVDLGNSGIGDQRVSFNTNVGRLGINYRF
ncbi:outer membrane protein [Pararhizobium sp.]|uniref:outer membrane protein n=1 Tax=Pararhizobium sp. TaxID=1977563 RepID=UPI0027196817|nr:outer membrane beta-barrel protein [Pararhizobium sp.]MDO9417151.1 outer membrane beta-barrel protein [Pararhizobium sp.]